MAGKGNNKQNEEREKRSGFEVQMKDDKTPICYGWFVNKYGKWDVYGRPYSKSKIATSKTNRKSINLFVTIRNQESFTEVQTSGMFMFDTKRMSIEDWNLLCTTAGGGKTSGGAKVKGSIVRLNG